MLKNAVMKVESLNLMDDIISCSRLRYDVIHGVPDQNRKYHNRKCNIFAIIVASLL